MTRDVRTWIVPVVLVGSLATIAGAADITSPPATRANRTEPVVAPTAPGTAAPATAPEVQPPTIDVLEGLRSGQLAANAEGTGGGRITLNLTNRTGRKLKVVLPPGLIAAGATGQMGMMGGMGGGMMGGMGGMGGGMGGGMMGGGMGGMGGGMGGGMMGGRGGMGGGMGGMGGGTMPASMGMMMLGRLIMNLVGEKDSWNMASLMMGSMMGGMGGMGMMGGGMMGGMGGMGGGMMGGGFRSIPPTSLPFATLNPHQTRHLPTKVVSLTGPNADYQAVMPAKGEKLRVGDVAQLTNNPKTQKALRRLAEDKAPQTVAQLVLWNVAGLDWDSIARASQGWANDHERALARQFVAGLDAPRDPIPTSTAASSADSGRFYWSLTGKGKQADALTGAIRTLLVKRPILGLKAQEGVPNRPSGPALACRASIDDAKVTVTVATTDAAGSKWVPVGTFVLKRPADTAANNEELTRHAAERVNELAEGLLDRMIHVQLSKPTHVKGKLVYRVKVVNDSPLVLNGLALAGPEVSSKVPPSALAGICLPPHKVFTLPASAELVQRLGLKEGIHVIAADLSGL